MSLEKKIISAALASRKAYARIAAASDVNDNYSPFSSLLLKLIQEYYDGDEKANAVDVDVIKERLVQKLPDKKQDLYISFLLECASMDVSAINVSSVVLEAKKKQVGHKLAAALVDGDERDKVPDLIDSYKSLDDVDADNEDEEYNDVSVDVLAEESGNSGNRIRLLPNALNTALKGRTRPGHHIVIYARPECFDAATEVLTPRGWRSVKDVDKNTFIGSVDSTRTLRFERPEEVVVRDDFDHLFYICNKKRQMDLMVSPGHRMIYEEKGELKEAIAEDIVYRQGMKSHNAALAPLKDKQFSAEDAIAIAYQADGRARVYEAHGYSGDGYGYEIVLLKPRKIERLRSLLNEAGYKWNEWKDSRGHTGFYFRSSRLFDKTFDWIDLSEVSLGFAVQFAKELPHWDGSFRSSTRWKYSNTNEMAIDKAQAVVALSGFNTFKSSVIDKRGHATCYELHIRSNYCPVDGGNVIKARITNTKGIPMYCFKVSTGMLLIRRNGVISVQGNTGKTALTLTIAYSLCYQGIPTIIFGNEEPVKDTILRAMCCFTGLTEEEILTDKARAQTILNERNWNLLRFIPINPGTPRELDKYLERYKPGAFITDQIRNLWVGGETRVNQLEMAATAQRNLAKKHNALGISVTQAGDSADNKLVLEMGDVDFSNTGIPATADAMIGMGVNKEYEQGGLRMLSLPKNKIGGFHTHFPVRINTQTSRVEDV